MSWDKLCRSIDKGGLGFRSLKEFNRALLAKQGWRIMKNENSLVAQVLKSRYYKDSSFMEAKLSNNPSFTWLSILWRKEVLQKRLIWRVGDDRSISVYEDNWVPRSSSLKVYSVKTLVANTKVTSLLTPSLEWNKQLIYHHFCKEKT